MKALKKIDALPKGANLDKVAVTELAETITKPSKGVLRLLKIWEENKRQLTTYENSEEGLKLWMVNNARAIRLDGELDITRICLINSSTMLPMLAFNNVDNRVEIVTAKEGRDEMPKADSYSINSFGIKSQDELNFVPIQDLKSITVVTVENNTLVKTSIDAGNLESLKNEGKANLDIDFSKFAGIYGTTDEGTTVMAWMTFIFGHAGHWIEIYWGDDGIKGDAHGFAFP